MFTYLWFLKAFQQYYRQLLLDISFGSWQVPGPVARIYLKGRGKCEDVVPTKEG